MSKSLFIMKIRTKSRMSLDKKVLHPNARGCAASFARKHGKRACQIRSERDRERCGFNTSFSRAVRYLCLICAIQTHFNTHTQYTLHQSHSCCCHETRHVVCFLKCAQLLFEIRFTSTKEQRPFTVCIYQTCVCVCVCASVRACVCSK